jgi:Fic family protein
MQENKKYLIGLLQKEQLLSSKQIHDRIDIALSYATVKRLLSKLLESGLIESEGKGKATRYRLSRTYDIIRPIDANDYFRMEIDDRSIHENFNLQLIREILPDVTLFTRDEMNRLQALQKKHEQNRSELSDQEYTKEMERLAIDLSWKSSQIEGNTYSLLETERLLKEKETAEGKTKDEAVMLLNHKEALDFIINDPRYLDPLTVSGIEDIHSILIKDLPVDRNIRKRRVGISGTNYKPPDNEFQIREALQQMCDLLNDKRSVFEKALLALLLTSYIQPFNDGNKRTARILSNAILINNNHCPLSFRTIDPVAYKKAMLIFYEQNNLSAFKETFIGQFEFAVNTYF